MCVMKSFYCTLGIFIFSLASVCSGQWVKEKNYPGGSTDAVIAFTIGDSIYVGGGSAGSTAFYKFDPSTDTWTPKANLPEPRAFAVSFSIGSNGYMALGQTDPVNTGQASVAKDLWEYDALTNTWSKKANFPGAARDASFAFVIGNKAYVGGGTDTGYRIYSDFYSYDPSIDKWDTLNPLPDYLYFNAAFAIGNYGYIATGVERTNEIASTWQYDPSSDSWNQVSDFPGAVRESAVSFTLNGKGYVGLGQSLYTTVFSDFYAYDPSADQWSAVTDFPASHGRGWAMGVATPSAGFVGLGTYFSGPSLVANNDIWKFDLSAVVAADTSPKDGVVYPNPVTSFVNLSLPNNDGHARITVQNSIGRNCLTIEASPGHRVDLSSLPAGIYNLEIISGDYHSSTRIVKE